MPFRIAGAVLRWAVVLWAFTLILFFEHQEGLFGTFYLKNPSASSAAVAEEVASSEPETRAGESARNPSAEKPQAGRAASQPETLVATPPPRTVTISDAETKTGQKRPAAAHPASVAESPSERSADAKANSPAQRGADHNPLSSYWPNALRVNAPEHAGAFATVLTSLFTNYPLPWRAPNWENMPGADLGFAIVACVLYLILGYCILELFAIYPTPLARAALAFPLGVGAAGVVFELLALAHFLNQPAVIATWFVLIATIGGIAAWRREQMRRDALMPVLIHSRDLTDPLARASTEALRLSESELRAAAAKWFDLNAPKPGSRAQKFYFALAAALTTVITLLVTIHAIGQPEAYWDSLILYLGYARMTFEQHAFPVKVVGQVGIGLGANYPHMFEVLAAATSAIAGQWSDMSGQLLPPVCGIFATLLVYATVAELTRDRLIAISAALLFRAVPYGMCYFQYASSYALTILFTAAFLYLAWKYIADALPGYRDLMLLIAAFAVHVNYLMWLLWAAAAAVILIAHIFRRDHRSRLKSAAADVPESEERGLYDDLFEPPAGTPQITAVMDEPRHIALRPRPTLWEILTERQLWIATAAALLIASPWYIRNVIVTGNPVYAFFTNIFTHSKRVNPEVMKSAVQEWKLNGDGLYSAGQTLPLKLLGDPQIPLSQKIFGTGSYQPGSWYYFVLSPHAWKLGPIFIGFVLPGVVVALGWSLLRFFSRFRAAPAEHLQPATKSVAAAAAAASAPSTPQSLNLTKFRPASERPLDETPPAEEGSSPDLASYSSSVPGLERFIPPPTPSPEVQHKSAPPAPAKIKPPATPATFASPDPHLSARARFAVAAAVLFLGLWFYAYVVADYYLYQIVNILPLFAIFAAFAFLVCNTRPTRAALYAATLLVGFAPGIIMGLMGFKLKSTGRFGGPPPQLGLTALKRLFMPPNLYYQMAYDGDYDALQSLRGLPLGSKLLTHENRTMLLPPKLPIIHLDDWEVQQTYRKPAAERLRILDGLGITHYLYVPNEDKHVVNDLVGMDELVREGHFVEIDRYPASSGSAEWNDHKSIPKNANVVYKRNR